MPEPITLIVQQHNVVRTADGGRKLTFVTTENFKTESAKISLMDNVNLELTIKVAEDTNV